MNIFLILVGVSVVGILVVFWLLKNEDKPSLRNLGAPMPAMISSAASPAKRQSLFAGLFVKSRKEAMPGGPLLVANPPVTPRVKKPSLLAGLVAKFKKEKKEAPVTVPLPSVTDFVEKSFVVYQDKPEADRAAPQVVLSAAEEKKIEQEIDLAAQIEEWKGKHERLDKLFNEKSAALAKFEESLKAELNNRKEFNKIKDILEKDLREARDKTRSVQMELNTAKTEAEGNKKKAAQLEEKITKMEKALLGKDDEIAALNKRLPAAASAPPVAAAPEPGAPPEPPVAPAIPEAPAAPVAVVPAEPPAASHPEKPELEQRKGAGEPEQPKEEGFLKLQPDILASGNPPDAAREPEVQPPALAQEGGLAQSAPSVPPEANPQDAQDKSVSQEETNKNKDEPKAAF